MRCSVPAKKRLCPLPSLSCQRRHQSFQSGAHAGRSGGQPFMSSFEEPPAPTTAITSGDDDTDRAIDLAVDTLFVEELEAPPPETTQLEVGETEVPDDEDFRRHVAEHAGKRSMQPPRLRSALPRSPLPKKACPTTTPWRRKSSGTCTRSCKNPRLLRQKLPPLPRPPG